MSPPTSTDITFPLVVGNAPGPWFVDQRCIDCGLCRSIAPGCFGPLTLRGLLRSVVSQQPATIEERKACESAALNCPVQAIGNSQHGA